MGSALDKTVCNNQLIKYLSGLSKTQIHYTMVRNKDRKRERDVKVFPGEEVAQQHQLLVCDLISAVKEVVEPFAPKKGQEVKG